MKLIKSLLIFIVLLFVGAGAANAEIKLTHEPNPILSSTQQIRFTFKSDRNDFIRNQEYIFNASFNGQLDNRFYVKPANENLLEVVYTTTGLREGKFTWDLCIRKDFFTQCNDESRIVDGNFTVFGTDSPPAIAMERYNFRAGSAASIYILNAKPNIDYRLWFDGETKALASRKFSNSEITPGVHHEKTATLQINVGDASPRSKILCMTYSSFFVDITTRTLTCDHKLTITVSNTNPAIPGGYVQSNETDAPKPVDPTINVNAPIPTPPCDVNAKTCPTAFGNISTDPAGFIRSVFTILLSLAGGVALLLIISSGYRLMTSQGNPERVQGAREQLTSAIVGLLFIIFSLSILTIIGVDILKIPGFGK